MKSEGQKSGESSATDGTPDRPRKKTSTPMPSLKIGSFYPTLNDVSLMAISSSDDDEENEITEFLQSHSMVPLDIPIQNVASDVHIGGSDSSVQSPAVEKSATKRKRKAPSKQRSSEIAQGMSPLKLEALQRANSSQDSSSPRRKSSSKKKKTAVDDKVMMPSEISETVTHSEDENDQNNELHKSHSFEHKIQGSAQKLAAEFHRESSASSFKSPAVEKSTTKKKRKTPAKLPSGAIHQEMSPLSVGTIDQTSSSQISGSQRKKHPSKRKSAIVDGHVTQPSTVSQSFSLPSSCDDGEKHRSAERHKRPSSKHKIRTDVSVQNLTSKIPMESSDTSFKSAAVEKSATKKKRKTPSKQPPGAIEQEMSPLSTLNRVSGSQSSSPRKKSSSKKIKSTVDVVLPSEISESVLSSSDDDENIQNEELHKSQSSKGKIHSNPPVQKLAAEFHMESSDASLKSPVVEKSATKRKRKTPAKPASSAINHEMPLPNLGTLHHASNSQESGSPRKKSPSKKIKSTVDVVLPSEISESVISSSEDDENIQNEELHKTHSSNAKIHSNASVQKLAAEFHMESSHASLKSPVVEKSVTKRKRKTPAKPASSAINHEMPLPNLGTLHHANSAQESGSPRKKSSSKKNKPTVDVVLPSEISESVVSSSDESEIILNTPVQKLAPQFNRESSDASLKSPALEKSATKRKRKTPAKSASIKRDMSPLNLGTLHQASRSENSVSPRKTSPSKKKATMNDDHVAWMSDIAEIPGQTPSQHPVKAERGTDHVDMPSRQMDAGITSDDSSASDSSSLADSSSEDEAVITPTVVEPAPEQTTTEDRLEEESRGETSKQMR